jgi:Na+-driven multidrug efflux pump
MYATINTVVINTLLDPLFIYGFDWGIRGAAIATVIAQIISLVWQLRILANKNELLHLQPGIYRLKSHIVKNIIAIGLSPFCMNVASCFIVIFINKGLKEYDGDLAIGAYGIVNRLVFICVMIVMGITQGMQPIAGFNFGAQRYDRLVAVLKLTILFATLITTLGFVVGTFLSVPCVSLFAKDSPHLIEEAAHGLRIIVLFFPFIGMQIVSTAFFQSIGHAGKSIFLSLTRQLIFLLPALLILPHFFERSIDGVWYASALSDALATILSAVMLFIYIRKFKTMSSSL